MTDIILQVVTSGVVANIIAVPSDAVIAAGEASATWSGGGYPAPLNSVLMQQDGAGIGWTLSGGVLIAPSATATSLTKPQLQAAAWAKSQTLLSTSRLYAPAGVTMPSGVTGISCDALSSSDNLQGLNIWGMSSPVGTQPWTDNVYNVFTLTGAQGVAFADSVLAYGQSVYAALATVVTAINSGSVTTLAQIASAAWPT